MDTMRRLVLSCCCVALGVISLAVAGCQHAGGICDCDQRDPCLLRAPWVRDLPPPLPIEPVKVMPPTDEKKL